MSNFLTLNYLNISISVYRYRAQEDQYNEFRMFSEQLENELELSLKVAEDRISSLEPKSSALEYECHKLKV